MAVALIVAAGSGERLGADRPKAFVMLGGRPMVQWSVDALRAVPGVDQIVVALPEGEEAPEGTVGVPGGASRSASVRAALKASTGDPVIVHDAARPLATTDLFQRALEELESVSCDGVVVATPVTDTVKRVAPGGGRVLETFDRSALWAVQTPQVFRRDALERALADDAALAQATDDASLVERAGGDVRVIGAPAENIKITTPRDLRFAGQLLAERDEGGNLAVVRRMIELTNAGDPERALQLLHPDVVWDVSRLGETAMVTGSVFRGHEGARRFWIGWASAWEAVEFEVGELVETGDDVVGQLRQRSRGRRSGVEVELAYGAIYTLRDGLITSIRLFEDHKDALCEAGLA